MRLAIFSPELIIAVEFCLLYPRQRAYPKNSSTNSGPKQAGGSENVHEQYEIEINLESFTLVIGTSVLYLYLSSLTNILSLHCKNNLLKNEKLKSFELVSESVAQKRMCVILKYK